MFWWIVEIYSTQNERKVSKEDFMLTFLFLKRAPFWGITMPGGSYANSGCGGRDWRIWVRVIEARHVMWRGVNTRVAVRVGRNVQTSSSRPASSAPYFGEEFTFTLNVALEELLDQVMTLSVQQTQAFLPRTRVLGKTELDICTIWEQPDHQIYRKWALLNHPNTEAPAGFLLVDLAVLGHGDHLRLLSQDQTGSPIEQNLLAPSWAGSVRRCRARYAIRVYFAEGLPLHKQLPVPTTADLAEDPSGYSTSVPLDTTKLPSRTPSLTSSDVTESSSSKTKEKDFAKAVAKKIKSLESRRKPNRERIGKTKLSSRFVRALRPERDDRFLDVERQLIIEDSDSEPVEAISTPRKVRITRGLHSCGCKARYLVRINFAGMTETTTKQGCDHFQPSWSEEIIFPEMFPPLYQRMCIQLSDSGRLVGQHRLHLNRATCDPAHLSLFGNPQPHAHTHSHNHSHGPMGGIIASYGPVFLNLSGPPLGRNPIKPRSVYKSVRGPQPRGRILIELKVLCADSHTRAAPSIKKYGKRTLPKAERIDVVPLQIKDIWRSSELTLACVVWDLSLINRSRLIGRKIGLQISLGSAGDHLLWQHHSETESRRMLRQSSLTTPGAELGPTPNCPYLYIPLGRMKPVLAVTSRWPWCVPDLRAANHIDRLAYLLQYHLTSAGKLFEKGDPEAARELASGVDSVITGCKVILEENGEVLMRNDDESEGLVAPGLSAKALYRVRQIEGIAFTVLEIGVQAYSGEPVHLDYGSVPSQELFSGLPFATISSMYRKAFVLLGTMHDVIGELGGGMPDVTIWLLADEKRVAAVTMPARWLLAARKQARRGRYCGRLHSVFLRDVGDTTTWCRPKLSNCTVDEGGAVLAKIEAVFWLGTHRSAGYAVQKALPGGSVRTRGLLPFAYHYIQEYKYECFAHVYQGRFSPGPDRSGLSDPFVRVIFGPHCAQTEVSEASLSPRWRRSLRLPPVYLCGDPADVQNRPPMVVIETWDRDAWTDEFLGRILVRPRVRLLSQLENPYRRISFVHPPTTEFASAYDNTYEGPGQINFLNGFEERLSLRWFPMLIGNTRTGDVLASVELVQVPDDYPESESVRSGEKKSQRRKSRIKSKDGKKPLSETSSMTDAVSPEYTTYRLEIIFWGLRDLQKPLARPYDRHLVVFEIAGTFIQSSRLNPTESFNFPDCYTSQIVTLPVEPELLPAVHIKLLRRPVALLRHHYVATNVIPSLSLFLWDVEHDPEFHEGESMDANIFRQLKNVSEPEGQFEDIEDDVSYTEITTPVVSQGNYEDLSAKHPTGITQITRDTPVNSRKPAAWSFPTSKINEWKKNVTLPGNEDIQPLLSSPEVNQRGSALLEVPRRQQVEPDVNWWERYYASLDQSVRTASEDDIECGLNPICHRMSLKRWNPKENSESLLENELLLEIYPNELEAQYEFESFQDFLLNIELNRGKAAFPEDSGTSTEEGRAARAAAAALAASFAALWAPGQVIATLKACVRLERLALGDDRKETEGRLLKLADNRRQQVTVRVYVIRAHALHGRLRQGRADPFLNVTFGRHSYDGHSLRQRGVLDPIFGKCIEFQGEFPCDHRLIVRVMDHVGVGSGDRLLGQTVIDLENRFYSRHYGGCGLPRRYDLHGPNAWRDSRRPTDILANLCRAHDLPDPVIDLARATVAIDDYSIQAPQATLRSDDPQVRTEEIALAGLLSWHTFPLIGYPLVPAHVETRSLIHPNHPGVEQGKLEMWVDVVPTGVDGPWSGISSTLIVPPPLDVEPPLPRGWELRIVVLQAKNVVGTEWSIFYHDLSSDVYLAGWIGGIDEIQKTDVHYRSLDGNAVFNWRLVFPFQYISPEGRIVIGDRRLPPRVHLSMMDYDTFTKDDLLGSMTLDLRRLPRPAGSASKCGIDVKGSNKDGASNRVEVVDLFKVGHARGWWPVLAAEEAAIHGKELAGKVELDLQLVTQEEAAQDPVGLGRNPPHELEKPTRPNDAISMLRHPFLGLYYIVWKKNRCKIILSLIIIMAVAGLIAGIYSLPQYLVKRLFGIH